MHLNLWKKCNYDNPCIEIAFATKTDRQMKKNNKQQHEGTRRMNTKKREGGKSQEIEKGAIKIFSRIMFAPRRNSVVTKNLHQQPST